MTRIVKTLDTNPHGSLQCHAMSISDGVSDAEWPKVADAVIEADFAEIRGLQAHLVVDTELHKMHNALVLCHSLIVGLAYTKAFVLLDEMSTATLIFSPDGALGHFRKRSMGWVYASIPTVVIVSAMRLTSTSLGCSKKMCNR